MKLLLLQPPIQDFYDTDIRLLPMGLAYLKGSIKQYCPDVQVLVKDYHHGRGRRTIPLPRELAYLKDYYACADKSPFSTFHQYYHFGASFEAIADEVADEQPDLVGISSLFTPYYREVLKIAAAIKSKRDVPIILGGSHVSAVPEQMLGEPVVDFVIRGEGERPIVDFLKAWSTHRNFSQVPNLGWKKNGNLVLNPLEVNFPVDQLAHPDFEDFKVDEYLYDQKPMSMVMTSRGCPYRCSFCSIHPTFGFQYRKRSVEHILEEMQKRYTEGIRVFDFEDDHLTYFQEEMKELCRRLIQSFPQGDVQLVAMNGLSYWSLDSELLRLMKKAGFTHLNISLVSANEDVRLAVSRPHSMHAYETTVREAARLGFRIVSYQILGLPGETLESMIETLIGNARLPVLLGASMFYLAPGSPISQEFPQLSNDDLYRARLTAMAIESDDVDREDLYTLFVTSRIINFLKGISLPQGEMELDVALKRVREADKRAQIGAELLRKLLVDGKLFAATDQGAFPLRRFKSDLFRKIWEGIGIVATQDNKKILLPKGGPRKEDNLTVGTKNV
ncbi:MAG: B12-binding domain-containing radical SAM protein [Candidatus Omnitrophica bacterium]|nr:B12-binding domain-containing radical SAM protein [Candidatus Omnitrophota bacterium]